MAPILCLETATPVCSVALFDGNRMLAADETREPNAHSARLTLMIERIMSDLGLSLSGLDAVAVSRGPGSYTGLRIGAGVAKGICYALDIPLISVCPLRAMALAAARLHVTDNLVSTLIIPMIDARRMEVYSAVFTPSGEQVREVMAEIITGDSYAAYPQTIVLCGNGSAKCHVVLAHRPQFVFASEPEASAIHMGPLAFAALKENRIENTAYFEPFYLKDFMAGTPNVKGLK